MHESLSLIPPLTADLARVKAITEIVLEAEIIKGVAVGEQHRNALIRLLAGGDMTLEEISQAGRRLISRNTYGTIAYEHWLPDPPPVTEKISVRGDCVYCGSEWWGPPGMKCPRCFAHYHPDDKEYEP